MNNLHTLIILQPRKTMLRVLWEKQYSVLERILNLDWEDPGLSPPLTEIPFMTFS